MTIAEKKKNDSATFIDVDLEDAESIDKAKDAREIARHQRTTTVSAVPVEVVEQPRVDHGRACENHNSWLFKFCHGYMSFRSRNAVLSVWAVNALLAILAVNAILSFLSINSAVSILSMNSAFSIASVNSAFAIGCYGKAFSVCANDGWLFD